MEPLHFPRYSVNLYHIPETTNIPPLTWPLRREEKEARIVDEQIWPKLKKKEPDIPVELSPRRHRRNKSLDHAKNNLSYLVLAPSENKHEGVHTMIPEVKFDDNRYGSVSLGSRRTRKTNPKIHFSSVEEEPQVVKLESGEEKVDMAARPVVEKNNTPPQVRRTLSSNFLKGPKIQRTSSASLLQGQGTVHALKETSQSKYPISLLPPHEIFGTVTRQTHWDEPVQPAFEEIVIKRITDKQNISITTVSPKKNQAEQITERTGNYYVRLVKEIYTQQGNLKIRRAQIKEQIDRLRAYEVPQHWAGPLSNIGGTHPDFETMQNDLKEIPCLEILRRLSTRGFAPATYAVAVLWPKLFPSPDDEVAVKNQVLLDGKDNYYLQGSQINSSGEIHIKRNRSNVIQRKLFEFSAKLLSKHKIPKNSRQGKKYHVIVKDVPIGALVLSLKSRHKALDEPYYEFSLRLEDVSPLKLSDLKHIDGETQFHKKEIARAERVQQVWLREIMEFKCEENWERKGLMIENGLMLYPKRKHAL